MMDRPRIKWTIFGLLAVTNVYLIVSAEAYGETQRYAPAQRGAISIMDYGAVPNRKFDSTAAIKAAVAVARLRRVSVFVPSGTFNHGSFGLDGVSMYGVGPASILLAPNPEDSTIFLRQSGPAIQNITVKVKSRRRDSKNPAICVEYANAFLVDSVAVDGGNGGGILNFGGSNGRITYNQVRNTLADAIHNTHGAHDVIIAGNTVRHSGDDMIAVVSYEHEPISHNFLIENNDVADQDWGRGIAVVGGRDVTIQENKIARTNCCAGIYLASEPSYKTNNVQNVLVRDNVLTDNSGPTHHGAITIFAGWGTVRNVRLERNTIINARHVAITLSGAVRHIAIVGNRMVNAAEGGITGDGTDVYCSGNTLDGPLMDEASCNAVGAISVDGSSLVSD